jgi:nucleoside-diphosphate-sugar epimerase
MRIVVLGGTGFIGPYVVRRLCAEGHAITVFHRGQTEVDLPPQVSHRHGDREQLPDYQDEFRRLAPEVVLDMRPFTAADARLLMDAFRGIARRVVAISSGDVYRAYGVLLRLEEGPLDPVPLVEDAPLRTRLYPYRGPVPRNATDPMRWVDDYEKILVERAVMQDSTLPGTVLRLPLVYGPGDSHHRLFPYLKRVDDVRPAIPLESTHAGWRWTRGYVEDVAQAITLTVLNDQATGRVYNVGESEALSEAEWVRAIGQVAGWRGDVVTVPRERWPAQMADRNYAQHLVTDTTRIRAELGYQESISREEALARTIAWERAHPPATIDPRLFDYAAEDMILSQATGHASHEEPQP